MNRFKLSVKAKQDLKNIATFTQSKWGRDQRNIYLTQFDQTFRLLANKATLGRPCNEIGEGYFKYPQDSHIIFFRKVTLKEIFIVRILHRRMDYASNVNG